MTDRSRLERSWLARDPSAGRGSGGATYRWLWQPETTPFGMTGGVAWFSVQAIAMWFGLWPLAVVFTVAAGLAAGQTARAWTSADEHADVPLALLIGSLAPLAAATHTAAFGALFVAGVVVSILGASVQRSADTPPLRDAGFTIQSWMPTAIASGSMIFAYRYEVGAAVWLLCLVSIYDAGHYSFGAGSDRAWGGPFAGIAGIGVVAFALVIVGVPPHDPSAAGRFAVGAAFLIPAGVALGSLVLPGPGARAGAFRRLDSLMVAGPLWAWSVGRYLSDLA